MIFLLLKVLLVKVFAIDLLAIGIYSLYKPTTIWRPRGLMDKASDFESEDCAFESRRGRSFDFFNFMFLYFYLYSNLFHTDYKCNLNYRVLCTVPAYFPNVYKNFFSLYRKKGYHFTQCLNSQIVKL